MPMPMPRLLSLALVLSLPGCFFERGNGEPMTRVDELGPFHAIDLGGVFELQAAQAAEQHVELRGDANLVEQITLEVEHGVLRARTPSNMMPKLDLVLVARTPALREVELSGASKGEIVGLDGEAFELALDGASRAVVRGAVERASFEVSGASDLDAAALVAQDVDVDASGASSADVTANAKLVAEASGASSIRWGGEATNVERDVSGASSIERR